ncbi:mechanosensitive ion channel family protein [Tropicimonas sp. TH_r6]|uniref:mechanosensitive ion channel family protein n=1 Tax=Tropicimonas sp. TH_r6 TaxID=3082085 RepID=UPI002954C6DC|nr:mechanosensitive ion channel family protein [Tropicimonas sp. TH_r6]MDV7144255.1 mechanosensitive ion channel family protein [Tropicimonas sp. TH_r6]
MICLRDLLSSFLLSLALVVAPVLAVAQDSAAPAEQTAAPEEAATTEQPAPELPAELTDVTVPLEDFKLRLLPLTLDELTTLAEIWQGIVQDQTQAGVDKTIEARADGSSPTEEETNEIVALTEARGEGFARFSAVVDNFTKKGGDEAVAATFHAYMNAISVDEKQQADFRTLLQMAMNWTISTDGGLGIAKNVIVIIFAFFVLIVVARIVRGYARRLFARVPDLSKLLQAFLTLVVYWLTIAIGLMVVLSALGVDITPLFAVVGGASFIIAFAMQDTLGNLAAGLMIMFNRPFDEGDYITAGGTSGTVSAVSVVSTKVKTPDNQVIIIPNSKVWGDVITNTTASEIRRVDLVFGIGYDDSIEEAQRVLEEVVAAHEKVLSDPAPVIRVGALADSSVNFIVRPWTLSEDYWAVLWDLNRSVKEAFDAHGISIPFPQADMHIKVAQALPIPTQAVPSETGTTASPDIASGDSVENGGDGDRD